YRESGSHAISCLPIAQVAASAVLDSSPARVDCGPEAPIVELLHARGEVRAERRHRTGLRVRSRLRRTASARDDGAHAVELRHPGDRRRRRLEPVLAGERRELLGRLDPSREVDPREGLTDIEGLALAI